MAFNVAAEPGLTEFSVQSEADSLNLLLPSAQRPDFVLYRK